MSSRFPVKILFVGDMHLGRRASRVPERAWSLGGLDPHDLSPLGAWRRIVQSALDEGVNAVALAGDLIHQDDDLFEARAHLETGIRRLTAAGIGVAAVAGNHDTYVLPVLARVIDGLHLLGAGGTWSTWPVADGVRLAGWSFPARHHSLSPLQQPPPAPPTGVVTLGLLHADLDVARSEYAPVARRDLELVGYDGWCVGHIHAPDPLPEKSAPGRPFYLGAINGSIPTETGAHGPVLATIGPDSGVAWRRLPLAPLRWETAEIAVDGFELGREPRDQTTNLRNHLLERVSDLAVAPAWADPGVRALGVRVHLTGRHAAADALRRAAAALDREDLVTLVEGRVVFIEKITSLARVAADLTDLARRTDPPGLIARQILALKDGSPETDALLDKARLVVDQLAPPAELDYAPWNEAELRDRLIRAGQETLDALLNQNGGGAS